LNTKAGAHKMMRYKGGGWAKGDLSEEGRTAKMLVRIRDGIVGETHTTLGKKGKRGRGAPLAQSDLGAPADSPAH